MVELTVKMTLNEFASIALFEKWFLQLEMFISISFIKLLQESVSILMKHRGRDSHPCWPCSQSYPGSCQVSNLPSLAELALPKQQLPHLKVPATRCPGSHPSLSPLAVCQLSVLLSGSQPEELHGAVPQPEQCPPALGKQQLPGHHRGEEQVQS